MYELETLGYGLTRLCLGRTSVVASTQISIRTCI